MSLSFVSKNISKKNPYGIRINIKTEIELFNLGIKPALLLSHESMKKFDCFKLYYDKDSNEYRFNVSDEFSNKNPPTLGFINEDIMNSFLLEPDKNSALGIYLGYPRTAVNLFLIEDSSHNENKEEVLFNGLKFIGDKRFRTEIETELKEMYPNLPFNIQYLSIS